MTWKTISILGVVATIITIFCFVTGITSLGQLYNLFISGGKKNYSVSNEADNPLITIFKSGPQVLSKNDVKNMLRKHNFYCRKNDDSEEYCNPNGKGFYNAFELRENGQVVYDFRSGLRWQQNGSDTFMKHEDAEEYIKTLNAKKFSGFDDWRLPTLEEAMTLIEPESDQRNDKLYIDSLFDGKQLRIWTADQEQGTVGLHWVVCFYDGYCTSDDYSYVRAVR